MKKITFLFTFIFAALNFFGQDGWTKVPSGLTTGKGIGQISIGMNDNTALWGLAVNADGLNFDAFTRSTDGGITWAAGTFNAGSGLSQIFAIDASTCWAVFNTGATQGCYKTTDGGTTWAKQGTAYGSSSFANLLHFFNEMDGVTQGDPVNGYFEIYTTMDGGQSWTRVPSVDIPAPLTGEYGITGNYCTSGDIIWFGTNMGRIFKSTDMGFTWTASVTTLMSGTAAATVSSVMFDDMNGLAYTSFLNNGMADVFNTTTDGGETWVDLFPEGQNYARYISLVPGTENTIIGTAGSASDNGMGISISYDGGVTWDAITQNYSFLASAWIDIETGWSGTDASATSGMYIFGNPPAPGNLEATVDVLEVMLTWDAPETNGLELLGYNVFRNDEMINTELVTTEEYIDADAPIGIFEYYVTAVYTGGESDPSNVVTIIVTNIIDNTQKLLKVYPNPAVDVLNIEAPAIINRVRIMNIVGQTVYSNTAQHSNSRINISDFESGVYFVQIETELGTSTQKIVVE